MSNNIINAILATMADRSIPFPDRITMHPYMLHRTCSEDQEKQYITFDAFEFIGVPIYTTNAAEPTVYVFEQRCDMCWPDYSADTAHVGTVTVVDGAYVCTKCNGVQYVEVYRSA